MPNRRERVPFDPHYFERLAREGVSHDAFEAFERIRRTGHWEGSQSISGEGASDEQTAEIRSALPSLLRELDAKKLLDVPCGDFRWMRNADLPVDEYVGGDLLPSLIADNQSLYGDELRRFVVLDLTKDALPAADVLLCRDCLVHLSFDDAERALANIGRSPLSYLLTTTFPDSEENEEIVTGDWSPINLEKPPFNFPPPLTLINEKCSEVGGLFADKSLGLWAVRDLRLRP